MQKNIMVCGIKFKPSQDRLETIKKALEIINLEQLVEFHYLGHTLICCKTKKQYIVLSKGHEKVNKAASYHLCSFCGDFPSPIYFCSHLLALHLINLNKPVFLIPKQTVALVEFVKLSCRQIVNLRDGNHYC